MNKRLDYIDGLRAVAVLTVLAFHTAKYTTTPLGAFPARLLASSSHGVDVFFVISGLCLSLPFLRAVRDRGSFAFDAVRFYAKRIVRIVPVYYATIALLVVASSSAPWRDAARLGYLDPQPTLGEVAREIVFLDFHMPTLNGSFWTLALEFRWYFLFPFALALFVKSPRAFVAVVAFAMTLLPQTQLHGGTLALGAFMLGIVAAEWEVRGDRIRRFALPAFFVLLPIALVVQPGDRNSYLSQPLWQLVAFAFVVAVAHVGALRRVASFGLVRAAGIASYSIYVVHEPIVAILRDAPPLVAGAAACLAGGAMWFAIERFFTDGRLREPIVEAVRRAIDALARGLCIGRVWNVRGPHRSDATLVPERSDPPLVTASR